MSWYEDFEWEGATQWKELTLHRAAICKTIPTKELKRMYKSLLHNIDPLDPNVNDIEQAYLIEQVLNGRDETEEKNRFQWNDTEEVMCHWD